MYQYFVKIVPTVYKKLNGEVSDIMECYLTSYCVGAVLFCFMVLKVLVLKSFSYFRLCILTNSVSRNIVG